MDLVLSHFNEINSNTSNVQNKAKSERFAKIQNLKIQKKDKVTAESPFLPDKVVHVDEASTKDTHKRIHMLTESLLEQILTSGKPSFEIPSSRI